MNQPELAFAQAKNPDRHSDYVCTVSAQICPLFI